MARSTILAALLLVAAYGVLLALGALRGFPGVRPPQSPMPYLSDQIVGEDGFYMLLVAWNIAEGRGVVGNEAETTTGVQPLVIAIYAGLAKLVQLFHGDKWQFVRVTILFNTFLLLSFCVACGKIAQTLSTPENHRTAFAAAFLFGALNLWLFLLFTYGLETGLYLLALSLLVLYTLRNAPFQHVGQPAILGLLAGICGWARVDFGIVFFFFLVTGLVTGRLTLNHCLRAGLVALAMVAPWFLWVHHVSGAWIPSSGPAQGGLIDLQSAWVRTSIMGEALLEHMTPWLYGRRESTLKWVQCFSLLFLAGICLWKRGSIRAHVRLNPALLDWGAALVVLIPLYLIFFKSQHFYGRYTAPLLVLIIPLLGTIVSGLGNTARAKHAILATVFLVSMISSSVMACSTYHVGKTRNFHAYTAAFVRDHLQAHQKVGAFQSGVVGYFNPKVLNLDGKLNGAALKHAEAGTLEQYIDDEGITAIVDWPSVLCCTLSLKWLHENWVLSKSQPGNGSVCYVRR